MPGQWEACGVEENGPGQVGFLGQALQKRRCVPKSGFLTRRLTPTGSSAGAPGRGFGIGAAARRLTPTGSSAGATGKGSGIGAAAYEDRHSALAPAPCRNGQCTSAGNPTF